MDRFVKSKIIRLDSKLISTVLANFCFGLLHFLNVFLLATPPAGGLLSTCYLYYFRLVTLFAVHDLRAVGGVGGLEFIRAARFAVKMGDGVLIDIILRPRPNTSASPMPKLQGVSLFEPLIVAAVRAKPR